MIKLEFIVCYYRFYIEREWLSVRKILNFAISLIVIFNLSAYQINDKEVNIEDEIDEANLVINNEFFFSDIDTDLKYCARYNVNGYDKFDVTNLHISKLKAIENGILYRLTFDKMNRLNEEFNIIIFVTGDIIYRLKCSEAEAIHLKNEAEIDENSYIACSYDGMSENWFGEDPSEDFYFISAEDDFRYSHYVYRGDNDKNRYYERFYWNSEKGLVYYLMGTGYSDDKREFIRIYEYTEGD